MRRLPECPCPGFFPYVILNVFFPDLFDMADHDVEQRQLTGITGLLAPSGHTVLSLPLGGGKAARRNEDSLFLLAGLFSLGDCQLCGVFNDNAPVFFIKNNLIPFFHVELSANGEGQRDLTARSDLGKFHEFSLKSYLQDKSYL